MSPYSDDIQSPDWPRDYPSNGGDAIAYQNKGHLWDTAKKAGVSVKNYGEYIEYNTFTVPGCTPSNIYTGTTTPTPLPFVYSTNCEPSWNQFYNDSLEYDAAKNPSSSTSTRSAPTPRSRTCTRTRSRTTHNSTWAFPISIASTSGSRTSIVT